VVIEVLLILLGGTLLAVPIGQFLFRGYSDLRSGFAKQGHSDNKHLKWYGRMIVAGVATSVVYVSLSYSAMVGRSTFVKHGGFSAWAADNTGLLVWSAFSFGILTFGLFIGAAFIRIFTSENEKALKRASKLNSISLILLAFSGAVFMDQLFMPMSSYTGIGVGLLEWSLFYLVAFVANVLGWIAFVVQVKARLARRRSQARN